MLALITFNEHFGGWSAFTFWTVIVSVILTLGFTIVVFFGGLMDLRYLLHALSEEQVDATDDGRVEKPPARGGDHASNETSSSSGA